MLAIQVFIYLQVLDFITTMIGFKMGASEASPFIVNLIHHTSPAIGVAASKLVALGIGGVCVGTGRVRLVSWINYWYAGLVVWNLSTIFAGLSAAGAFPHVH
jgi:hypothetical protein